MIRRTAIAASLLFVGVLVWQTYKPTNSLDGADENCCGNEERRSEESIRSFFFGNPYAPQSFEEVAAERAAYIEQHGSFDGLRTPGIQSSLHIARWQSIGPYGMTQPVEPFHDFSGLILTIAKHFDNGNILYVGTANGGVWKSTDGGNSWFSIHDNLPVPTVSTIAPSPTAASTTVWIGTGSIYGGRGGGASFPAAPMIGYVYRSTNGGLTWQQVALPALPAAVNKIEVEQYRPSYVYVATNLGLYRSTNNGATWETKLSGDYSDVVVHSDPVNVGNSVVIASRQLPGGGIFRSSNGGVSFVGPLSLPGLTSSDVGRITLAHSNTHTSVYASISSHTTGGLLGLYRSTNRGDTWTTFGVNPILGGGRQGYRNNALAVSPVNGLYVLLGWDVRTIYRSTNGGSSWSESSVVHEDVQDILFDDANPQRVWHVSDGGVFRSTNAGALWLNSGGMFIPVAQIYYITPHPTNPQRQWIGTQDNGMADGHDDFLRWGQRTCCDGGDNLFFNNWLYNTIWTGNATGANRWQRRRLEWPINQPWDPFTAGLPFGSSELSPLKTDGIHVYTKKADTVYKATNGELPWSPVAGSASTNGTGITRILAVPGGRLYAGMWANSGPNIRVYNPSTNLWQTPTVAPSISRTVLGFAQGALLGSHYEVFVALSGTSGGRVYRTTDGGTTWMDATGNLPSMVNVTSVLVDRISSNIVYAGSDFGVYGSSNRGQTWLNISDGLPGVPFVTNLGQRFNGELLAGTFGRGAFAAPRGVTDVARDDQELPSDYALSQNYPNPFNPSTEIVYRVKRQGMVSLKVYDVRGREVATLVNEVKEPGEYAVTFDASNLASGVYLYTMTAGSVSSTKKMTVIK